MFLSCLMFVKMNLALRKQSLVLKEEKKTRLFSIMALNKFVSGNRASHGNRDNLSKVQALANMVKK